jgi:hypothetical protein
MTVFRYEQNWKLLHERCAFSSDLLVDNRNRVYESVLPNTRFRKSETEIGLREGEISLILEEEPEYSVDSFRLFKPERFCITELKEGK